MAGVDDAMIIQAIRERMLDEIRHKRDAQSIVNNVYGGPGEHGGVMGGMGGQGGESPEDRDYFVDILKEQLDPANPDAGWRKKVRRYSAKHEMPDKKKI